MSGEFEKILDFDSDTFEEMKRDMNFVLQRLIGNMQEKGTNEGSMTLKLDVTMVKEFIPNYNPDVKGETREVSKPQFKHKVTSAVKINDEKSGAFNNEMELVMDEDTGVFKLVPITNTAQRSIFDSDFQQTEGEEHCVNDPEEEGQNVIEGAFRPLLPGPAEEDTGNTAEDEGNVSEEEWDDTQKDDESASELGSNSGEQSGEPGVDLEDITDELLGNDSEEEDSKDDGYGYEEPDE